MNWFLDTFPELKEEQRTRRTKAKAAAKEAAPASEAAADQNEEAEMDKAS